MSEQEVRNCLEWARDLRIGLQRTNLTPHYEDAKFGVASHNALSAEPDIVVLLRWADEQGFWEFCRYIEEHFHVRLIDEDGTSVPGWEYIAE